MSSGPVEQQDRTDFHQSYRYWLISWVKNESNQQDPENISTEKNRKIDVIHGARSGGEKKKRKKKKKERKKVSK
jgi:hypothetical protein